MVEIPTPTSMVLIDEVANRGGRDQMASARFWEVNLYEEVNRRADQSMKLGVRNAGFEETCPLEDVDWSSAITLDRRLL